MSVIDKVVTEWAFRCKKGYPDINNPDDMKVLKEIYSEYGIVMEEKAVKEQEGDAESELIKILGAEKAQEVMKRPLYQSASTAEFIQNPGKYMNAFSDLFHLFKKSVSGKGELIPLVAIKGAKTGGNQDKDILTPEGKVIEVKDLVKGGEFATGSKGNPKGSIFAEHLETFMKYLAAYDKTGKYAELIDYYRVNWPRGNLRGNFLKDIYEVVKELKNTADTSNYVKIGGKHYILTPGKEYSISIDGNGNLTTELPQAEEQSVAGNKIQKHPWVSDISNISKDLQELTEQALEGIDYFLLYKNEKPIVIPKEDFSKVLTFLRFSLSSLRLTYQGNF
jgi:hypothetical protein